MGISWLRYKDLSQCNYFKSVKYYTQNEIDTFQQTMIIKISIGWEQSMQNFIIDNGNHVFSHWIIL